MTKHMLERLRITEIVTDEDYRSHALPCEPFSDDKKSSAVSEKIDNANDEEARQMPA
ncbi:MAG: hypothetical protein HOM95_02875 [Halieaceae bacterium]|jgi:hypothetical protein|nr:hypothetical protein [Halieaceae bacterium]